MCGVFWQIACGGNDAQRPCQKTVKVCEWNPTTQAFDRDCRFTDACLGDAGANDGEAANDSDVGPTDVATEGNSLKPALAPTNALVNGKLAESYEDPQGGGPVGWDTCGGPGLLQGPRPGKGDPAPKSGAHYMVFSSVEFMRTVVSLNPQQMFFYFPEERSSESRGLWFDVRRLSGELQSLRLVLTSTSACQTPRPVGTYDLRVVASSADWTRTCAPFPQGAISTQLGLRIEGSTSRPEDAELAVGFDSFALGPPCP